MKKRLSKYGVFIAIIILIVSFIVYYSQIFSTNYYPEFSKVKQSFSVMEKKLDLIQDKILNELKNETQVHDTFTVEAPYFLHIYKNDTLVYWNTNKIPVSKFVDLQYPTNGLIRGRNGWYYAKSKSEDGYIVALSFLIKHEYAYQNEYLKNEFSEPFKTRVQSYISLDEVTGFPIYSSQGQYLFSIVANDYQPINESESLLLMCLLLSALFLLLWKITQFVVRYNSKWTWLFPIIVLGIRFLSLNYSWLSFFKDSELYSASLYGSNALFPNFLAYIINILLLFILSYFVFMKLKDRKLKSSIFLSFLFSFIPYLIWMLFILIFKGLVEDSSIPLHIEELFKVTVYSIIAVITIAILGFSYFIIGKTIIRIVKSQELSLNKLIYINLLIGLIYVVIEYTYFNQLNFSSFFPFLFVVLIAVLEYKEIKQKHLILGMALLAIYSLTCAIIINEFNQRKGKSDRELYASQLMIERDIVTELEYSNLVYSLQSDKFLQQMISSGVQFNFQDFESTMERRHFNKFWERYECKFFLFNDKNEPLLNLQANAKDLLANLTDYIDNHGKQSEINPSIYFITDYIGQFSYIIRQDLYGRNDEVACLYITLKSKKIPEEIGYPRLLISSESSSLQHLDNYSIAKYHNNKLVSHFGLFNYPNTLRGFNIANPKHTDNFNYNGYNHLIRYKSKKDVVVLSGFNTTWIDIITSFSYLFCCFGLLLLPFYIRFYANSFSKKSIALSTKIQVTLISIVVVSLVISGISSGVFIKNQYNEYAEIAIREKVHSIENELNTSIGKLKELTIQNNGSFLNYQLFGLSNTFNTDINIYDTAGFLISTSRQNVFNSGLLSEQINPIAKMELTEFDKSEFIHTENIGSLKYNSAYSPIFNKSGKILGYINLQHFGQQEEVEHQIQQFLMSIISIFVLLLAASVVAAIFTANWITNPLQMLQRYVSNIHLGKSNHHIHYTINDEIGALVKSYNKKIDELESTAQQLAQSERESAWREMAKQVAHEIKNPLTPMKLSVQHLMRTYDPTDENSQEKINKVSKSLIEQIDALTKIANEFSNFAKIQKPVLDKIDIIQIIQNATELFRQGNKVKIQLNIPEICYINGDKEQLLRVFNNLIKNSTQAISNKDNGVIAISAERIDNNIKIAISDNGNGISEEQKPKIFTPYFTTKSTGSGIGLSMVKQTIVNHGGDIYFESSEGIGTTFFIELPVYC